MLSHLGGQISERAINCNHLITYYTRGSPFIEGLATDSLEAFFIVVVLHF